jgi:F-type H+-transporting ATPase subunit b
MVKRLILAIALLGWLATPALLRASEAPTAGEAHATEGHAAEGHGDAHEASAPLLPDPSNRSDQLQALWVLIIFIVLLMVLYPTAWKNILAGLKKREERIRADIADATAARRKAEEALAEYNQKLASAESQMRDILSKAAADAEKLSTQMKMTAQQEVEEIRERATRDIEAARKAALSDIYAQAAELSTSIASKILRRNINADDQRDLVNSSIQQFSTAGKA